MCRPRHRDCSGENVATVPSASVPRRDRTRNALLVALQEILLKLPPRQVSVPQVISRAGLSQGTFYNYFGSLDGALDGVGDLLFAEHTRLIDEVTAGVTDPVQVFALATRQTLALAGAGDGYGRLLFDCGLPIDRFPRGLYMRMHHDLIRGIDEGCFHVEDVGVALTLAAGGVLGAALDRHRGRLPAAAIDSVTRGLLGGLGVDDRVSRIASAMPFDFLSARPLPLGSVSGR